MKAIRKSIKAQLASLFREMYARESSDISHWRQRQALEETGRFVEANLPTVRSFDSRYALFRNITAQIKDRSGLVCEFGVAGGKSINSIAKLLPQHVINGFDSFAGLPEDWRDGVPAGAFKQESIPEVAHNVRLFPGLFEETLPPFLAENGDLALFLHIDCDLYSSTKTVFDLFGDRIVAGTVLCFDEFFNYPGWQNGEFKAFMEFAEARNLQYEYLGYARIGTQLALRIE
jgi:hypothetical protein